MTRYFAKACTSNPSGSSFAISSSSLNPRSTYCGPGCSSRHPVRVVVLAEDLDCGDAHKARAPQKLINTILRIIFISVRARSPCDVAAERVEIQAQSNAQNRQEPW